MLVFIRPNSTGQYCDHSKSGDVITQKTKLDIKIASFLLVVKF